MRSLPVTISILLHVALLILTAAVAWRITAGRPGRATVIDFSDPAFGEPPKPQPLPETQPPPDERAVRDATLAAARPDLRAPGEEPAPEPDPYAGLDPFAARPLLAATPEEAARAVEPTLGDVRFVGVGAANARSVVYVVDCSGPMVSTFPLVRDRVIASVDRLRPTQKFGVVAFRHYDTLGAATMSQREAQDNATEVFAPRLVRATPGAKARLREWFNSISTRGRSAPSAGLRAGLKLEPDAIFLLSRSIARSGGGVWDQGLDATLAELDRLNPIGRNGLRPTTIKTIQFIDDDPTGIMRAIARAHAGDAQDGYTIIKSAGDLAERE